MGFSVITTLNYLIDKYAPYDTEEPVAADAKKQELEAKPLEADLQALKVSESDRDLA